MKQMLDMTVLKVLENRKEDYVVSLSEQAWLTCAHKCENDDWNTLENRERF